MKIAIIGCGAICPNHIRAIKQSENEICALCDILPDAARAIAERFELGELPIYTDYKEMLDTEKPDVVHICTPHYLHPEMCVEALTRDINVLCEKPIAISYEGIDMIKKALNTTKAQLGVCFQNRYEVPFKRLKELTADGVQSATGTVVWKRGADYYNSAEWRGTWEFEGGGVMINQAIHTLDMLMYNCGMPSSVIAHVSTDTHGDFIEVEDTASARFECENGTAFHIFATNTATATTSARIEAKLASGNVLLVTANMLLNGDTVEFVKSKSGPTDKAVWGNGHAALITHFYECLESGEHFPIDLDEASKSIRLILAMYASNGKKIEIK